LLIPDYASLHPGYNAGDLPHSDGGEVRDPGDSEDKRPAISRRHPLFGCLKGTVQVAPGVDLTKPADPEWGDHVWADRPWSQEK